MAVIEESESDRSASKAERAEKKAARRLRKAADIGREAPLTVASQPVDEARETRRQARLKEREAQQGGEVQQSPAPPAYSPEELRQRREFARRLRQEAADGPAGKPASPIAQTPLVAAAAAAESSFGPSAQPAAPRARKPLTEEEERLQAKRRVAKAKALAAQQVTLPESWPAPVSSGLGGGPSFVGSETAPVLTAPVLKAPQPGPYQRLRDWLAPRPGARGAAAGLVMFLFWEICRALSGEFPGPLNLLIDVLIWALVGLMAWRIFLWWETHDA